MVVKDGRTPIQNADATLGEAEVKLRGSGIVHRPVAIRGVDGLVIRNKHLDNHQKDSLPPRSYVTG